MHLHTFTVSGAALLLQVGLAAVCAVLAAGSNDNTQQGQPLVKVLGAIGYWPADEGEGVILHDRSGNDNHGEIFHTPWDDGLLNFTGGFQWAEIPSHSTYQSKAFTVGGWVFSRRESYGRDGMLFIGTASRGLRLKEKGGIEIISRDNGSSIKFTADEAVITPLEWHSLLYTYEGGVGRLYVNGALVQEQANIGDDSREGGSFSIGNDASWWMLHPPESQSLDGTIRNLVLFDRALPPQEVTRLHEATRPVAQPRVFAAEAIVIDGREVPLESLPSLPADDRQRALEQLEKRDVGEIRQMSGELLPILSAALEEWQTCRVAAGLLVELDSDEARAALREALPRLIQTVRNEEAPPEERLAGALALVEMREQASDAVPALVAVLHAIDKRDGVRLPRIEDLLRNAVMRALLDIDPHDGPAREALGEALAKPALAALDLSRPSLAEVRSLVEAGRFMDALDTYRALSPGQHGELFFSQGDPYRDARQGVHERSYTAAAEYNGFTYRLGEGKAYAGVERISEAEYEGALQELAAEYPAARQWRQADAPHLYRAKITKTDAEGNEERALVEGDWFIFDGDDEKVRSWSIAVDKNGFIHVMGGQHNVPNPTHYIPGSWERMGLSRDREAEGFPTKMYWVSKASGDIESFEFIGRQDNQRDLPDVRYLNYINFVQDNDGELFLYGRINVFGIQSWGLYRYDVDARRWSALGGQAHDVIESGKEKDPGWRDSLIRQVRGAVPTEPGARTLAWAWQPHFYNYCRANRWGVQFDRTNRMHVRVPIRGLDDRRRIVDADVYAFSDDGGETFRRAEGTQVELPLTINPAPRHNADIHAGSTECWWALWLSLLADAGY